jgi:hypothetical protein
MNDNYIAWSFLFYVALVVSAFVFAHKKLGKGEGE